MKARLWVVIQMKSMLPLERRSKAKFPIGWLLAYLAPVPLEQFTFVGRGELPKPMNFPILHIFPRKRGSFICE